MQSTNVGMGILRCLVVVLGAFLALEPYIIVRAGGGETARAVTTCVTDGIAAVVTLAISKEVY